MTKRKHLARVQLSEAAAGLAQQMMAGAWDHLPEIAALPGGKWSYAVHSLAEICPGFSEQQYEEALSRGVRDNR